MCVPCAKFHRWNVQIRSLANTLLNRISKANLDVYICSFIYNVWVISYDISQDWTFSMFHLHLYVYFGCQGALFSLVYCTIGFPKPTCSLSQMIVDGPREWPIADITLVLYEDVMTWKHFTQYSDLMRWSTGSLRLNTLRKTYKLRSEKVFEETETFVSTIRFLNWFR